MKMKSFDLVFPKSSFVEHQCRYKLIETELSKWSELYDSMSPSWDHVRRAMAINVESPFQFIDLMGWFLLVSCKIFGNDCLNFLCEIELINGLLPDSIDIYHSLIKLGSTSGHTKAPKYCGCNCLR